MSKDARRDGERTVTDFGDQWTRHTHNEGHYASQEMFADILGPLLKVEALADATCADIGAGTGRITAMILNCGATHVTAVEPSRAVGVLRKNLATFGDRVRVLQQSGEEVRLSGLDYVFSVGVLHHIPDPRATVERMFSALRSGGRAVVWLYGREGNGLYLALVEPLRAVTRRLPVPVNEALAWLLYIPLAGYIALCRWLPLPMRAYMRRVLAPIGGRNVRLVILDQLNPTWAKYYSQAEARALLQQSGFVDVQLHHRHGYSWTVIGTKQAP